jgi:hypothetical protein
MLKDGRTVLYLDTVKRQLTNWPGSLVFPVHHIRTGAHNIARRRYDAWFRGPDGQTWHAIQYGDMTQLAHCRRTKGA